MSSFTYHRELGPAPARSQPTSLLRWFSLFCAFLFAALMTAQAAHMHRPARPGHHLQAPATAPQNSDSEEHCPLCVAMHAALPSPLPSAALPQLVSNPPVVLAPVLGRVSAWSFATFCRPPPPVAA